MIDYLITEYRAANEIAVGHILEKWRIELLPQINDCPVKDQVEDYYKHNTNTHRFSGRFSQPSPLLQLYNLTSSLYMMFDLPGEAYTAFRTALRESLDSLVKKLVNASSHQLKALFQALQKVISVVETKRPPESPVIILELPLGNSIPCKILAHLLDQKNISYEIVQVSLNRNDTNKAGITRTQLLQEKLAGKAGSFLIYIDEWVSGANFDTITGILSKLSGIMILPVAMLEYEAENQPGFISYSEHHEKRCKPIAEDSNSLRFTVPRLNLNLKSEQPFIWAEHDRITGYRKADFAGRFIYTMKHLMEAIIHEPAILEQFLDHLPAAHQPFKEQSRSEIVNQCRYFVSSYWPKWETAIKQNVLFNKGEPEEITVSAVEILQSADDFTAIQFAVQSAIGLLKMPVDAIKRYPYKELVPYCEPLTGEELLAHRLFIKECLNLYNLET